ncbi:TfoX/Sxy family protein [Dehalogenimonas etheniformans]|uniref:Competence protein TfoX n=1 Tax=Dehalogenimonas etheniformans TaxID=1536648 RepID=A0A2P5P5N1_9CHLR|nr:TfoX/Sxy family protein [Dehalogenimonas etheniformans]PPD57608.1 competence protein TfoX [Dehalogenimonas etheniformans]QNT75948.1 TfoX/Sxy family protein [Dehalogenimonas etheniformans]
MSATKAFLDLVLERLGTVTGKSMFGGFGVFHDGEMFGLISNGILYLKADDSNPEDYLARGSNQYKPMPYFRVPEEVFENSEELPKWAQKSVTIAYAVPKKKK